VGREHQRIVLWFFLYENRLLLSGWWPWSKTRGTKSAKDKLNFHPDPNVGSEKNTYSAADIGQKLN
jgi:hypothetical protein